MITDLSVQQEIEKELQWDAGVNPNHIAVLVKNGDATLAGDVDSYWEKCEAERAAWRVAHVRKVVNHLRVELPFAAERGDDDITLAAMGILEWNCTVPATVEVAVTGSVLTLTGVVGRAYQREEAERAMTGLVGIKGIVNSVRVEGGAGDARAGIEEALKRSALVDASHVKVHVTAGVANLRGTVKTRAEWEEAMRAAWAGPGIVKVEDHLAIG